MWTYGLGVSRYACSCRTVAIWPSKSWDGNGPQSKLFFRLQNLCSAAKVDIKTVLQSQKHWVLLNGHMFLQAIIAISCYIKNCHIYILHIFFIYPLSDRYWNHHSLWRINIQGFHCHKFIPPPPLHIVWSSETSWNCFKTN